jgi:hypothetical protein
VCSSHSTFTFCSVTSTFTCTPPSVLQRVRRDPTHDGAGAAVTRSTRAVRALSSGGGWGLGRSCLARRGGSTHSPVDARGVM